MMKAAFSLPCVWLLNAVVAGAAVSTSFPLFTPTRISFDSLIHGASQGSERDAFWKALQEVGLVSITNIPSSSWNKRSVLDELQKLMQLDNEDFKSIDAAVLDFDDGTRRRTLATRTLAGHAEPLFAETATNMDVWGRLQEESGPFRRAVNDVSKAVAAGLASLLEEKGDDTTRSHPALLHDLSGERSYNMEQVVNEGEHLEHFHCYYKDSEGATTSAETKTIDWHTDQGLLLIFTPGQQNGQTSGGFFIQLADGSAVEVDFDGLQDDLVVMLGDGVNQYVNPVLMETKSMSLRAVPHALQMPFTENENDSPRVWYGRMVLPPPDALHPSSPSMTFGDVRTSMIEQDPSALTLGCASHHQRARVLDGDDGNCTSATSAWCWHRCMNYTDYDVSPDICANQSLSIGCANEEGLLWITEIHNASFVLACLDLETAVFATVPNESSVATNGDGDHDGETHVNGDGHDDGHSHGDDEDHVDEDAMPADYTPHTDDCHSHGDLEHNCGSFSASVAVAFLSGWGLYALMASI